MLLADLDTRLAELLPNSSAEFAIAFSGGGDSTALLHALRDHPQLRCAYILDHNLRDNSDQEARQALKFAQDLGVKAQILTWENQAVHSAIQERARTARYGLIGAACRVAGIKYLLTAHHKDDQAETLMMRYEHKTGWRGAAGMSEITYAPIWPEMALVTIIRPLLDVPRSQIMAYNTAHRLNWIEDPSNRNTDFERVRIRQDIAKTPDMADGLLAAQKELRQALNKERKDFKTFVDNHVSIDENGIIRLYRICANELFYYLLRVASGEGRLINRTKIARLTKIMHTARFTSATLGGALIRRNPSEPGFLLCRDLVAVTGRKDNNIAPLPLHMQFSTTPQIWDGRFLFSGKSEFSLNSVHAARDLMDDSHKRILRNHPVAIRQTLPVILKDEEIYAIGAEPPACQSYQIESLVQSRLDATLGY